jgi:hypothetical protein
MIAIVIGYVPELSRLMIKSMVDVNIAVDV